MENHQARLYTQLEECGYKGRVVSIRRLQDLQNELEERHMQGLLDETFYQERLKWFSFDPPAGLQPARSIIVVAVPRPQTKIYLTWNAKTLALILPPTYLGYHQVLDQTEALLTELLSLQGFLVTRARLPEKLLSVHNALIGCILCQQFCPENKPFLNWFEGSQEFSHEETELLLQGATPEMLSVETIRKLEALEPLDALDILPRNLGIFFGKPSQT